jgi:hypothetical protein
MAEIREAIRSERFAELCQVRLALWEESPYD